MMYRFGNTVEGMVESALEYLRVCESERFDQVVFSMKSSSPRLTIHAYRLLAARLLQDHRNYPFHLGVTEAGQDEDGRLKSAAGIGALLLDGIGDTVRISLTEDPVHEIRAARELIAGCNTDAPRPVPSPGAEEEVDFYTYKRRPCLPVRLGPLMAGGRELIRVGTEKPPQGLPEAGDRRVEWYTTTPEDNTVPGTVSAVAEKDGTAAQTGSVCTSLFSSRIVQGVNPVFGIAEIIVEDTGHLEKMLPEEWPADALLWSVAPGGNCIAAYRHLAAWLAGRKRRDPIIIRGTSDGSPGSDMLAAAQISGALTDGIGDMIHMSGTPEPGKALHLAYDILQACGARRTKTEFISCPGCSRTLFDLEATTGTIRRLTGHLGNLAIAVMGCIVNGPGEMADADFGYVGGAPGKVNLYFGKECVRKNIPEHKAPLALVELIKEKGRWKEPE